MERDPAMVWDYSPPSGSRPAPRSAGSAPTTLPTSPADDLVPLRRASRLHSVSVATLQSWCRKGLVRAIKDQGRWLASEGDIGHRASLLPDRSQPPSAAAPQPVTPAQATSPQPETPPGDTLLVPRDAWDKMLSQLGNLHEAGQQLAEARERAAKAETEVAFLRERLAELRGSDRQPATPAPTPQVASWVERARALIRRRR